MTLEEAVRSGDVERALFEVGALAIAPQGLDNLAEQWLGILAGIAQLIDENSIRALMDIQRGIVALIDELEEGADGIKARTIFLVTTKLVLLRNRYKRRTLFSDDKHIAHLREKVMAHFPEGATLSEKGMERFSHIIEDAATAGDAERALVVRIIAGLCKLYSTGDTQNLRMGLEYMSRRRLAVFADESDLIGILWDIMRVLDGSGFGLVATAHRLFMYRQKKKDRPLRRSLLWACAYAPTIQQEPAHGTVWTYEEEELLRLVATKTPELWKQVRSIHKDTLGQDGKKDAEEERREEQMRLLMSYMPRRAKEAVDVAVSPLDNMGIRTQARTFHVAERGRGADSWPSSRDVVRIDKKNGWADNKDKTR